MAEEQTTYLPVTNAEEEQTTPLPDTNAKLKQDKKRKRKAPKKSARSNQEESKKELNIGITQRYRPL